MDTRGDGTELPFEAVCSRDETRPACRQGPGLAEQRADGVATQDALAGMGYVADVVAIEPGACARRDQVPSRPQDRLPPYSGLEARQVVRQRATARPGVKFEQLHDASALDELHRRRVAGVQFQDEDVIVGQDEIDAIEPTQLKGA